MKEFSLQEKSSYATAFFGSVGQSIRRTDDGKTHLTALIWMTIAAKVKENED